jgi:hypothetical protein
MFMCISLSMHVAITIVNHLFAYVIYTLSYISYSLQLETMNKSHATLMLVILLAILLEQLTDAVALPLQRRQQQEHCAGMDRAWLDDMWTAYKNKYGRSYDATEDVTRFKNSVHPSYAVVQVEHLYLKYQE